MACAGECKIQIYDFDLGGLRVSWAKGCPPKSASDLEAEILKEIEVAGFPIKPTPTEPACDKACECIPLDVEPKWTIWSSAGFKATIAIGDVKVSGGAKACEYVVAGLFAYCSATLSGNCSPKPQSGWKRPTNKKRPKFVPPAKPDGDGSYVPESPGESKEKK